MANGDNNDKFKLSLTEQLAFSTVRIEVVHNNGNIGVGTGFFYKFELEENINVPVLITNKHVIQDSKKGTFLLTKSDNDGTPLLTEHIPIRVENFENKWIKHPKPDVDLALLPIAPIFHGLKIKGTKIFYKTFDKSVIPTEDQLKGLTAVEDILMVGYPIGLWDKVNNYPIFRQGITATHPSNDYNGKAEFMIDSACFPGSSGSPVVLYNVGNYVNKGGGTVIGSRFYFLGVLYGGPQYTATGEIKIINVPTIQEKISATLIPINLGVVIKSKRILDFKELIQNLIANM